MDGSGEAFEPVLPGLQDTYWNNVEKCSELVSGDSNYKTLNLFYRTVKLWYSVAEKSQEEKVALVGPLYATILKRVESNYSVPRSRANNVVCVLYKQMKDLEIPCDEISVVESEIKSILLQDNADASLPLVQLISSKEFYSDVFIIRLKEFIVQNPIRGRFAVEKLSNLLKLCEAKPKHQKAVRKLYGSFVECLAYTLKKRNDLETSMKLLHVVPNDMINDDRLVQPLQDFMRDFGKDVSDLSLAGQFFLSIIGREDITLAKILQQYAISSELDSFNPFIDVETNRIDVIHVLYSALTRKKHYVNELFRSSISDFPGLPTDFKLVYGLEKLYGIHKISVDDTVQLLKKLKEYIDQLPPQQTHSDIVQSLIQNIRWIFKMSSWAASVLSSNVDVMCRREVSETLRTNVFRNLLNGDSPLSTLKRYNMFDQEIELDELVESELINLLEEHHDYVDVMILKGLLGIRLSIEWLILPDMVNDDNDTLEETDESELIEEQKRIRTLIQSISDLKFRTEVLENMFSLLFLTKQDISDGNETLIEDGAYDDSDQKEPSAAKKRTPTLSSNTASLNVVITSNSNFLCVNECVPKYLALMKDLTFQAQTELRRSRSGSDCDVDQKQRVTVPSSVKDLDEAKIRLTVLLQYISEAQWRYSVIEPAFVGSNQPKINLNASRAYNFDPYDNMWQIDSETGSSTAAEDNDDRKSKAPVFSSVVPCMLATPDQLLRYCLIENHIDRAKQVFKLFERKLTDTPEAKELFIAEKKRELNSRLKQVCSPPKKHVSRIAETAARGMKVSQVHSVYHEFLMEIGTLTNRKSDANVLLLDFGLTTASNVELSQAALECSLWNPDIDPHRHVSEKIQVFLSKLSSLILVTRDTNASKSASLPSLIAYNALPTLFTKPETLTAESVKSNKLKVCIEDLKQIISQEFTEDHDLSLSLSTVASVLGRPDREKASGKKLVVLYQKLLRLCPPGKYNYLKALFYHVRRVSRVLTECNERRSSHSRDDLVTVGWIIFFSTVPESLGNTLSHGPEGWHIASSR
ncbi:hypothetical protein HDE_05349 [Halotydeus destructor]|nr:hypothetical protein HDE_05349 [Halotydeus destructor]